MGDGGGEEEILAAFKALLNRIKAGYDLSSARRAVLGEIGTLTETSGQAHSPEELQRVRVANEGWLQRHADLLMRSEQVLGAEATDPGLEAYMTILQEREQALEQAMQPAIESLQRSWGVSNPQEWERQFGQLGVEPPPELAELVRLTDEHQDLAYRGGCLAEAQSVLALEEFRQHRERGLIAHGWDPADARAWARAEMVLIDHGHDSRQRILPAVVEAKIEEMEAHLQPGRARLQDLEPGDILPTTAGDLHLDAETARAFAGFLQDHAEKEREDQSLLKEGLAAYDREVIRRTSGPDVGGKSPPDLDR